MSSLNNIKKPKKKSVLKRFFIVLASVFMFSVFSSVFVYGLMYGGAIWQNLKYSLFLSTSFASEDLRQGEIIEMEDNLLENYSTIDTDTANPILLIPKIEVNTPIITPINNNKSGILASLEEGVGLYPGSVRLGNVGKSILLGHSSLASWYRGDYARIFSLLSVLDIGDVITVVVDGKRLRYEVYDTQVMSPDKVNSFVNQPTGDSELILVTCYPIGSASSRTVVSARLIQR